MDLSVTFVLGIVLLFLLGFVNGMNDVSKGIATLAGSGESSLSGAIGWGSVWTAIGSVSGIFWGGALLKTIGTGIFSKDVSLSTGASLAVIIASIGWVFFASFRGWPVSTTHALVGGLLGAGIATAGAEHIAWAHTLKSIALPLLFSPFIAIFLGYATTAVLQRTVRQPGSYKICLFPFSRQIATISSGTAAMEAPITETCTVCDGASLEAEMHTGFRIDDGHMHWLTSGLLSFARGLNDTPKFIAVVLPVTVWMAGMHFPTEKLFLVAAIAIGCGSWYGGRRVTTVMSFKITRMNRHQGLLANAISAFLVIFASRLGLPVSTTHVSAGAIMGVGLAGKGGVSWETVKAMVGAWLITVPVSALFAGVLAVVLESLFR
ncbi:MAG: inorganic phosphate transporter [Leptospirillum sp.]|jgi:PiT family inorganic phosphate transporter